MQEFHGPSLRHYIGQKPFKMSFPRREVYSKIKLKKLKNGQRGGRFIDALVVVSE